MDDQLPKSLKNYLIQHLRRIGYRNIHRAAAFAAAHKGRGEWECQLCRQIFGSSRDLHGDHLLPVVDPNIGWTSWDEYINRLFLGEIQAICKECHNKKSKGENDVRRTTKKQRSDKI